MQYSVVPAIPKHTAVRSFARSCTPRGTGMIFIKYRFFPSLEIAVFLFGLPVWTLPFALVGSICANVIQCTLQLFVDLFHPKLSWESEQQAVKQNFTVILGVLLNMAAGVALGILVFLFYDLLSLPLPVYAGAVCLVLAAVAFLLYKLVLAYGVKRIADYE